MDGKARIQLFTSNPSAAAARSAAKTEVRLKEGRTSSPKNPHSVIHRLCRRTACSGERFAKPRTSAPTWQPVKLQHTEARSARAGSLFSICHSLLCVTVLICASEREAFQWSGMRITAERPIPQVSPVKDGSLEFASSTAHPAKLDSCVRTFATNRRTCLRRKNNASVEASTAVEQPPESLRFQ